jgi:hypothetical protein
MMKLSQAEPFKAVRNEVASDTIFLGAILDA